MVTYFQQVVSSTGEMGTIMNLEEESMPDVLNRYTNLMAYYLASVTPPPNLGCFVDKEERDLNGSTISADDMNMDLCGAYCGGFQPQFKYFSLQFGDYCFCGNSYGIYGKAPATDCNMPCAGNASETCGGIWRNSVFQTPAYNLSEILPESAFLPKHYVGTSRVIVPTVRTNIDAGEVFTLRVFVLSSAVPDTVSLYLRPLGTWTYSAFVIPLVTPGRQVYVVSLPLTSTEEDFEYYVQVTIGEEFLFFPDIAPSIGQTVVVG